MTAFRLLPPVDVYLVVLCGINTPFEVVSRSRGQVAHVLLTRPPLEYLNSKLPSYPRSTCMYDARRQR